MAKKSSEKSCTGPIITTFLSTAALAAAIFIIYFNIKKDQKDTIINSQDREIATLRTEDENYRKRAIADSLKILELSKKLQNSEFAQAQVKQKIIFNDTTLCPGEGLRILDGKVIVSYGHYDSSGVIASFHIIGEKNLKIEYGSLFFIGPGQENFRINKDEYVLNCLGFVKNKEKGCIKISIHKK
ncbi:MAG: hypothetical protein A2W07_06835 [candidate division Zixibacteria bacterium RBG_16_43_9]|nr:MAG: hypothetical protein A2W07_06835 [candidate division Zixibacteria bacterium RBG_16_43_9]